MLVNGRVRMSEGMNKPIVMDIVSMTMIVGGG